MDGRPFWGESEGERGGRGLNRGCFRLKLTMPGCGADCSSLTELILSERMGLKGEDIMFTSAPPGFL